MAHTKEQRDVMALCGARKKNGETCRAFAGQGTNHPGIGCCKFHLGTTTTHEVHAVAEEAKSRGLNFGTSVEIEPTEALLAMVHAAAGHLLWLKQEISALEDTTTFEAKVLMRAYADERDRLTRTAKLALDAGVAERQIQIAERYGEALAEVLRAVFGDAELALTPAQQAKLPAVLRRHLGVVEGRAELVA